MEYRNALTIERKARVNADMNGDGSVIANVSPIGRGKRYLSVVIAMVDAHEPVTPLQVRKAMMHLADRIQAP